MKVDLREIENRPLISYDALGKIKGCALRPSELNAMIEALRAAKNFLEIQDEPNCTERHIRMQHDAHGALVEALSKFDFGEGEK